MVKKIGGYVLGGLGILSLAASVKPIHESIEVLKGINSLYLMGVGIVLVAIGAALLWASPKKKKNVEVPIYQGKNIVGYRRG